MDPITMSLLAAQGIAGLGKAGYGLYQQRAGKAGLAGVQEASRMKPAEYAEMLKEAKSGQAVQQRIDEINKALATSTDALQESGSRAVIGGIGKVVNAGTGATNQLLTQQQRDIMSALNAGAMGSERQIGRDTQREMTERAGFQNAINAGVQNTVGGLSDIGRTIGYGASMADKNKRTGSNLEDPLNFEMKNPLEEVAIPQPANSLMDNGVNAAGIAEMYKPTSSPAMDLTPEEEEAALKVISQMNNFRYGGVMQTQGEFSHDTNPIHMIQDGEVVGEMTGGEYVLNPKQAKAISKESKFFRNLLKTKRFK
jgi:hypothetical protein